MSKQAWYLLGWILASILGISFGLGHQSNWQFVGPVLGMIISGILSLVAFALCAEDN